MQRCEWEKTAFGDTPLSPSVLRRYVNEELPRRGRMLEKRGPRGGPFCLYTGGHSRVYRCYMRYVSVLKF